VIQGAEKTKSIGAGMIDWSSIDRVLQTSVRIESEYLSELKSEQAFEVSLNTDCTKMT
jgi:hypothetical protein